MGRKKEGKQAEEETKRKRHTECVCYALCHGSDDEHGDVCVVYDDGFAYGGGA